jgi:ubiquinol-cytochrome c reductase cytochrome c1 subunit
MSRFLLGFIIALLSVQVADAEVSLLPVTINLHDSASIQRGAKLYMNYCSGCHSLHYMRYNRMAKDLGLTTFNGDIDKDLLFNNLIFTTAKVEDPIEVSIPAEDARQWFGRVPPDLSLSARKYSPAWLYTYLKGFYVDKTRPFGTNNILIPDVAMPNILAPLAGKVIAIPGGAHASGHLPARLLLVEPGEMDAQQFDSALQDLVTFMVYVAEPVKLVRYKIGWIVILFLSVLLIVAYLLKKAYWRNINRR